jgi:hypothetical protein
MPRSVRFLPLLLVLLIGTVPLRAEVPFDLLAATPVGSWQRQESVNTDSDGNRLLSVIETGLLGEETRGGVPLVWVQTEVQVYRLGAAGAREPSGDRTVVQALVERSALAAGTLGGDYLRRLGREVIYQVGSEPPTRVSGAGQIAAAMASMSGTNTTPVLTPQGRETVTVAGARFDAHRLGSTFQSNAQLLGHRVTVDMQGTLWLSPTVPFGFVRSDTREVVNGVPSTTRSELISFGTSGAVSKITGTPRSLEIPQEWRGVFGSLQGLFGSGQ